MLVAFTYLVTKDLIETLKGKFGFDLEPTSIDNIRSLENDFLGQFWKYIPTQIKKIGRSAQNISADLQQILDTIDLPIVSLDPLYAKGDYFLQVTRNTNPYTGEVTIAQRPGYSSIERQIENYPKKVVLTDVGAFDGGTLTDICALLEDRSIEVPEIILGVCNGKAYSLLNSNREITVASGTYNYLEWIELRDLFGIDGRTVGSDLPRKFIPYWENLGEWASIPEKNVGPVKDLCLDYNRKLLNLLTEAKIEVEKIGELVPYGGK